MTYAVQPWFTGLADLLYPSEMIRPGDGAARPHVHESVPRLVTTVAGLTAVDGATVITGRYEVVAFGVKLARRSGRPPVERVLVIEPVEGRCPVELHPVQIGGTRHLSAAQFVQDQRESVALVASQDGRFTVFTWSSSRDVVLAHRVDVLLL